MAKPPRLLVQFLVITLVGGLAVGVCLALLIPGFRQIGVAHTYTAQVGPLRDLSRVVRLRRRRHRRPPRRARQGQPRAGERSTRCPKIMTERGDRHRGPVVLDQPRLRHRRVGPGPVREPRLGPHRAGRLDHHPAAREEAAAERRAGREPQDPRDGARLPPHREVHQAADPRAVPQHRLLRPGLVRREVGGRRFFGKHLADVTAGRGRAARRRDPSPERRQPVGSTPNGRSTVATSCSSRWPTRSTSPPRRPSGLGSAPLGIPAEKPAVRPAARRRLGRAGADRSCSTTRASARRVESARTRCSRAASRST